VPDVAGTCISRMSRRAKGLALLPAAYRLPTSGGAIPFQPFANPPNPTPTNEEGPWGPGVTSSTTLESAVPPASERADVSRAQSGDTRAFERLYRTHSARVFCLARRMIGTDLAGELTQDVFVRVWEKLRTFRGESAFGTWLHRVAINVILHRRGVLRVERGRLEEDEDALDQVPARPGPSEFGMDFEGAIGKLPSGARTVFVLHDVEGFKHEEIAELLGVTAGTSKAQLHRARMILRQHLCR